MWRQPNLADDNNKIRKEGSTILVVDNGPLLCGLVCVLLNRAGYEVIEANSGKEALPPIELHQPDLVLLEVNMPRVSGLEVCAWLRAEKNDGETVVLVMIGMADNESIENAFVEATIALAHAPHLKVVAEGVGETVQAKIPANLGCDEIQGYLCSRPLSVTEFDARFAEFTDTSDQVSHL